LEDKALLKIRCFLQVLALLASPIFSQDEVPRTFTLSVKKSRKQEAMEAEDFTMRH
jgi:hypothetical protein